MKRCPECRRDYYDDSLLYCLDDGSALLEGPASMDGPATAILSDERAIAAGSSAAESSTRIYSDRSAAEPQQSSPGPTEKQSGFANRAARPLIGILAVTAILVGVFAGYRYLRDGSTKQISSIAVLPFENRGSDADTEYLSDGLAESLIYRLSQIPELKVSPRSSCFVTRARTQTPKKLAQNSVWMR